MKYILTYSTALLIALASLSCSSMQQKDKKLTTQNDTVSYYIGLYFGQQTKQNVEQSTAGEDLDMELIAQGIEHRLTDAEITITDEEIGMFLQEYFTNKLEEQTKAAVEEGGKFLEENKKEAGVFETESGLQFKIVKEGNGAQPTAENEVTCHYEGRLLDGTIFDSSYERGEPATFALNRVIPGWTEGLQLMKEGAEYEFYIPSSLGYGEQGTRGIPPNSTLIFKVELIKVN